MMKKKNKINTLQSLVDKTYGVRGTIKREQYERGFEAFKVGFLLEQARTRCGLTQEELPQRCGTNKSYISRIENDASDIKLSTLIKIVTTGLGGRLKLVLPK
ncbi:MAG: helix-turn-helix domain-containing protein [Bacteroidota bacterium]